MIAEENKSIKEGENVGETILRMEGIDKSFTGVHALKGVDFDLQKGEVHALMGENGAGKSTLMKILTGIYAKDAGTITYEGAAVDEDAEGGAGRRNCNRSSGA